MSGLLQMEALFTCQRGPVSLPLGTSVAGFSALGSSRRPTANGPASPLLRRGAGRCAPLPAPGSRTLRTGCAGSGTGLPPSSQRGSCVPSEPLPNREALSPRSRPLPNQILPLSPYPHPTPCDWVHVAKCSPEGRVRVWVLCQTARRLTACSLWKGEVGPKAEMRDTP